MQENQNNRDQEDNYPFAKKYWTNNHNFTSTAQSNMVKDCSQVNNAGY